MLCCWVLRYGRLVLCHYSQLEDELHRRAAHRGSLTSAYALNSEVAAYTPAVLLVLRGVRALPLQEVRTPPTPTSLPPSLRQGLRWLSPVTGTPSLPP